ncbi:chloride channel protein [Elysia marginata]|uniref:Chloride channel protein n=1 Tax=Elysia marginata TaxID=1093978 RepID=A0AAV4FVW1_9GAST|nr:chloride channel protein [Elysia marginata]
MSRFQMIGSILTAPITVGFGGSVGLEGPTVATGAAFGSNISRLLHLSQTQRTLMVGCACAGAMSAIFKAPIAAIVFAVEVFSLDLTLISLLPLLGATLSAIITSYLFFGSEILLPFELEKGFSISDLPFYALLGVFCAFVSLYFSKVYEKTHHFFYQLKTPIKRILVGGLSIGILIYLIPPLYGEGFSVINAIIKGHPETVLDINILGLDTSNEITLVLLLLCLMAFKVVGASITFGAGGVGGIFAPTLFMGSTLGYTFAKVFNWWGIFPHSVSLSNFALVGMAGLMAGILHAPLTAIFLIAELTGGYKLFVPLMLTSGISYAVVKNFVSYSIYNMELVRKGELITHNKDHAVLSLMDIQRVIETNFIAIFPSMTLGNVVRDAVIKSNRNIFPVIEPKTKIFLGIILLDDIRSVMFDKGMYDRITVQELMRKAPEVIEITQDKMTVIMKKFEGSGAWNIPVLDNKKYLGFVSKSKLLTAYRRKLIEVTPRA